VNTSERMVVKTGPIYIITRARTQRERERERERESTLYKNMAANKILAISQAMEITANSI